MAELYPAARIPDVAGVAVTFDNLVLIYNTDAMKEAPKSWFDLADKKYAGKVAFNGMPDIQGLALVLILDKSRGGTDYLTNVDKGIAAVGEIAPNVLTWEPKPEVLSGDHRRPSILGAGWNARAQVNSDISGGKLKATLPAEGSVFQINTINLVANRPGRTSLQVRQLCPRPRRRRRSPKTCSTRRPTPKRRSPTARSTVRLSKTWTRSCPVDWIALAKVRDRSWNNGAARSSR